MIKLSLIVYHHKLKCLVKRLKCCVKVIAKVQTFNKCLSIFSEPLNLLWLDNAPFCQPECHVKRLVCYLQGQGDTEGSNNQNMTISTISAELLILSATKLSFMVHYHKMMCLVIRLDCCMRRTFLNIYQSYSFCTTDIFAAKLDHVEVLMYCY